MIEIFKHANYDFIGKKNILISITVIISLLGIISFFVKGFNLGIDFSGGTLVTVRFKKAHDDTRLRTALAKQNIDATKVIIQPISQIGESSKNDVLIRLPQTLADEKSGGGIDADKKRIIEALNSHYTEISQETRTGKVDVNNSGTETIKNALIAKAPLGGEAGAEEEYAKLASSITKFRDSQRGGLISDISEIPSTGLDAKLTGALKDVFYAGDFNIVDASVVGPQVGNELRNRAIYVTLASLVGMLIYIAFRFELIYGVGAVVATIHDVIVTLAFFSIFQWEISLNVIAALLTLIGYSMNDTIVIFDRIRETLRIKRRDDLDSLSNEAINQTLSRTIIISGLTFLSVCALVLFGGPVLRGFSLTLFIGILVGTYSSIAIATPIMLWWKHITIDRVKLAEQAKKASKSADEPKFSKTEKKSEKN
ncbi:MAG: protein translocase subunit SecF [Acidobacteria bacterium]|nr:protein translocase subunit SecF [Acidobacteriota bacterium]